MPTKKSVNSKTRSPAVRKRSKSAGRTSSKNRSRTPTRSRSRTRTTNRNRTPASESKVELRRSPSSSRSSSPSVKSNRLPSLKNARSGPDASGDKLSKTATVEVTANRFSRRIVQRLGSNKSIVSVLTPAAPQTKSSVSCIERTREFLRLKVCTAPLTALIGLVTLLPAVYWLNFLVFTPASSNQLDPKQKVSYTVWGTAYRVAGVLWPIDWTVYLDYHCHMFVFTYLMLHILLARFVPFGRRIAFADSSHHGVRPNGLFTWVFFCGLYAIAQFGGLDSITKPTVLLDKYWLGLLAATGNIASLGALIAHFASRYTPRSQLCPNGNTGNFLTDFWVGRSLHPRWFGVDWKWILLRPGLVALLLIEVTRSIAQWEQFGRVSPALCALTCMHFVWIMDYFVFEHTRLFTFDTHHEGLGYFLIVSNLTIPFCYSIASSYLSSRPDIGRLIFETGPDKLRCSLFLLSIVLFIMGYIIYRKSNNQKDLFRRQPNHPSFSDLDKISGPHSQRLLAGGWWGLVRHPNYLGDIIMAFAQCIPCGFTSPILWLYPIFLTLFLLHRIWQIEYLSSEKYGVSYAMYRKLVPERLIPKVF